MSIKLKFVGGNDNNHYELNNLSVKQLIAHLFGAVTGQNKPVISDASIEAALKPYANQAHFRLKDIKNADGVVRNLGLLIEEYKTPKPVVTIDLTVFAKGTKSGKKTFRKQGKDSFDYKSLLTSILMLNDGVNQAQAANLEFKEVSPRPISPIVSSESVGHESPIVLDSPSSTPKFSRMMSAKSLREDKEKFAQLEADYIMGMVEELSSYEEAEQRSATQPSVPVGGKGKEEDEIEEISSSENFQPALRLVYFPRKKPALKLQEEEESISSVEVRDPPKKVCFAEVSKEENLPKMALKASKTNYIPPMLASILTVGVTHLARIAVMWVSLLLGAAAFAVTLAIQKAREATKRKTYDDLLNASDGVGIHANLENLTDKQWEAVRSGVEVQRGGYFNQFKSCFTQSWKEPKYYFAGLKLEEESPNIDLDKVDQVRATNKPRA